MDMRAYFKEDGDGRANEVDAEAHADAARIQAAHVSEVAQGGQPVDRVAVGDRFGDLIMVRRVDPNEHAGGVVAILIEGNENPWVGTRAQFIGLVHAMSEMALGLTI
ncbi:MAG: hypothetical protein IPM54_24935 [Polyangiaceae bacterium]|nr:hypothetical protein [Polyangiaceae bacterium]